MLDAAKTLPKSQLFIIQLGIRMMFVFVTDMPIQITKNV